MSYQALHLYVQLLLLIFWVQSVWSTIIVLKTKKCSYLGCAEHKKAGCRGRATIPVGGWINELKMTRPHNHPPDINAEEKEAFLKELKSAVRSESMANATLKKVYETVATAYLRCLEYKRLGCHARAVIPSDGSIHDIKVNKPHNHPPDHGAEEKIVF
ncbi:unnamed protein product [Diabrotica balteata]|uniref:FLYWCH-type domain-containing protein n=1 Tax=Diabrotica balteata TaxID=107213 RepID=A0A9N9T236_DIABA|nr:unnamed protein product [Diabrotica balteata]